MASPLLRQIKASAGSGKTYDLTRRFLEHLARARLEAHTPHCVLADASDAPPGWGDILAVTFTNSAAAEMKERVIRRLKETALGLEKNAPIQAARAAAWVDVILRQYGALNIRTIDSLLHMVVRTAALDLNLPPDFEPAFAADETLAPILDVCLERAWRGETRMLRLLEDACLSLVHHAEAKGFTAGGRIAEALRPLLEDALTGAWPAFSSRQDMERRHADMVRAVVVGARDLLRRADEEGLRMDKRARAAVEGCAARGAADSAYLRKTGLEDLLLAAHKSKASDAARAAFTRLAAAARDWNRSGHILRQAMRLLPFTELAREAAAGLEAFQQEQGKVPGMLIPALAREVLELRHGVPAALCRLGSRLNHMLVDEFQDTSRPQWEALRPLVEEALSRGGSFTWVGDVKQAIYGWRQGDASLFDGVLRDEGLLAMAPEPERHSLDANWRSREVVVRCNNAVFSRLGDAATARNVLAALLPDDCPPHILKRAAADLSAAFADAAQRVRPHGAEGGHVVITPVRGENAESLSQAVREVLRERILNDLALRRAWGDVAILVRGNDVATLVAGWLMEWGVPVITENSLLLKEHPLVAELAAFLTFLDSPHDDPAFWTMLTGSLMAPCLKTSGAPAALSDWAAGRGKRRVSAAFREDFPDFWRRWFAPFHSRANLLSPYDAVQEWLRLLRVDERFPQARTFIRRFLEVLHVAEERGHAALGEFLEHWKKEGGDEKAPMPAGADAVRVMTIHKAKGLQFPVVVIPWMSFSLNRGDSPPVPWEMDGLRVLAPRCREMGDAHYAAQADAAREALNLWYVAWTRAEEELHVLHTSTPTLLSRHNLARAVELLLSEAELKPPCVLGAPPSGGRKRDRSPAAHEPSEAPRKTAWDEFSEEAREHRPMHWLPRLKIFRNPLGETAFTPKQRGILMHRCLERLRLTNDTPQGRMEDARRAVLLGLRDAPPALVLDKNIAEELIPAVAWYAALPEAALWLRRGLPEQNILDAAGRLHRVDLLAPPAAGRGWTAIDYKTGEEDAEHLAQMRRYLDLLAALPDGNHPPPQGVLVYLDLRLCRVVPPSGGNEA